jgi:hypothetical protein
MVGIDLKYMKRPIVLLFALTLTGCRSLPPAGSLTPAQATALSVQLANTKAEVLYSHQPFQDGQPAKFEAGHWVWSEKRGFGTADICAVVDLAEDGSTNNVSIEMDINRDLITSGGPGY